jgi:hypothetical protein
MITKQQWLDAIKETRILWQGVHFIPIDDDDNGGLINGESEELAHIDQCPFCILITKHYEVRRCKDCIANDNTSHLHSIVHGCARTIAQINNAAEDNAERAQELVNQILDKLIVKVEANEYGG